MLRDRPQIDPVPAVITEPANLPGLSQLPAATQLLSREAAFLFSTFLHTFGPTCPSIY